MNQVTMNHLRTAIDVRKLELVTEEIAEINREAAVKAEVARELDDFVATLNQPNSRLGADKPHLSATSGLTSLPAPTSGSVWEARAAPPRFPW
jgi:hypothetical protein